MLLKESTTKERIAVLTHRLIKGRVITAREFAVEMQVTPRTVQYDLEQISRVLPLYVENGRWVYIENEEPLIISPY